MANLTEGNKNKKKFISDGEFKVEVAFTKWTIGKYPTKQATFYENGSSTQIAFIKAILCNPPSTDTSSKYHLVLFVKEVTRTLQNPFKQPVRFTLQSGEKVQCVIVRFYFNETHLIPDVEDLDCNTYYEILASENSNNDEGGADEGGPIIPDSKDGSIIIGG